ncbi:MAG: TIGR00730 family Rossman fold protein [Chitinophagales bacterium]|nr:TIGR00730 family Rossman fold protein [Hyphomicrobiales bacterium]
MKDLLSPNPSALPIAAAAPRAICVYCGSGKGVNPAYAESARVLGQSMARAGITLVYGGSSNGLMGEIARATLGHGGHVIGIMPENLALIEPPLRDVQELIFTKSLHDRKMMMFERSDAFVALPGGLGTLEELVEQLTWAQLRHHEKPVIIANMGGYWNPLLALFRAMEAETFIRPGLEARYLLVENARDIVPLVAKFWNPAAQSMDTASL